MRKQIELDILANSRIAVANSYFVPLAIGCIIISTMYGIARPSYINLFFMWLWIVLACFSALKLVKNKKKIKEMRKDGS